MELKEALKASKLKPIKMAERSINTFLATIKYVVTDKTYPNGVAIVSYKISGKGFTKPAKAKDLKEYTDWQPVHKI